MEKLLKKLRPFFKHQKLRKHLLLQELQSAVAAWLKELRASNIFVVGPVARERALHMFVCFFLSFFVSLFVCLFVCL
jgi:hypothetical protein